MQLSKIRIRNYRLLIDAELEVDPKTTLIVGRNNTAKTSCFVCIGNVLEGENISFNDYPLLKRESSYYKDGAFAPNEEAHDVLADNFGKLFGLTVYAINPNNLEDKQVKSQKELHDLFPFHAIPAERVLGEDDTQNSSLGSLISGFFDMSEGDLDPEVAE